MAVVLADVVVVNRCKEERTPCPYISLYTTAPLVFPRCIYIQINISSPSPSLQLSLPPSHQRNRASSSYTTQQPSTHQTAYTCKRQSINPPTYLKHSSTINPSHSLAHFNISTSKTPNRLLPPLPPISALSPKSSPETPKQK